jgi:hypothetical protein
MPWGLTIDAIAEPHASEETAPAHPEVAGTGIAPFSLLVRARKPQQPATPALKTRDPRPVRDLGQGDCRLLTLAERFKLAGYTLG